MGPTDEACHLEREVLKKCKVYNRVVSLVTKHRQHIYSSCFPHAHPSPLKTDHGKKPPIHLAALKVNDPTVDREWTTFGRRLCCCPCNTPPLLSRPLSLEGGIKPNQNTEIL